MAKILVKVHTAKKDIANYQVQPHTGKAVHIKAVKNANYELVESKTGFAPENIITKRVGKDLYIAFEGRDINTPDLIIDNYYGNMGELVIGKAEDGLFYNYVPESAVDTDAI
ncbi:hypothetical protein, partial [Nitratifractor sp.]